MTDTAPLMLARVELRLTREEFDTITKLSQRFGTSRAAIARHLVREGIHRVHKLGSFTVELAQQ